MEIRDVEAGIMAAIEGTNEQPGDEGDRFTRGMRAGLKVALGLVRQFAQPQADSSAAARVVELSAQLWASDVLGEAVGEAGFGWLPDGWELTEDTVSRLYGASDNDGAPVRAQVTVLDGDWSWEVWEDDGRGDWTPVDPDWSWDDEHHDQSGPYEGLTDSFAHAVSASEEAACRRLAWWAAEGELIRAGLGEGET